MLNKKKNESLDGLENAYFFFLTFFSTFFGALATIITSKLQLPSICI